MSIKRIVAIVVIFFVGCIGWGALGTATAMRSYQFDSRLAPMVESLWGVPLIQKAPSFYVQVPGSDQIRFIMPTQNEIDVDLTADHRKKGLIWYSTYICNFKGSYTVTNTDDVIQKVKLHFSFPASDATYDGFAIYIDGRKQIVPVDINAGIDEMIELLPGQSSQFKIQYETRGIGTWRYQMDQNVGRVRNYKLNVTTNFNDVDYTDRSPNTVEGIENGKALIWEADDLITQSDIGVIIPEKLNPGPVTSRITFFAPVCLIFFFVLVSMINIMFKIKVLINIVWVNQIYQLQDRLLCGSN